MTRTQPGDLQADDAGVNAKEITGAILFAVLVVSPGCVRRDSLSSAAPEAPGNVSLVDAGAPGAVDAGLTHPVARWYATDWKGDEWSSNALPLWPRLHLWTRLPVVGDPEPAMIFAGAPGPELAADLQRAPLRAAHRDRLLAAQVVRRGNEIILTPRQRLPAGETFALTLAGWAEPPEGTPIPLPFVAALRVTEAEKGGSQVLESWPARGAAGVPPNLALAAIRLRSGVPSLAGIHLQPVAGPPVPTRVAAVGCRELGWAEGYCVAMRPRAALVPNRDYRLVVESRVKDWTGAPVGPWQTTFRTADRSDESEPSFSPLPCTLDETANERSCTLIGDDRIRLRFQMSEPVRVFVRVDDFQGQAVAPRGSATLMLPNLRANTRYRLALRAVDLAGLETHAQWTARTTEALPAISITEVRANPEGPEPQQEYVEILNAGVDEVDVTGFTLSDASDQRGDPLAAPWPLPSGGRALVVADNFDPNDTRDVPVPDGAMLIRIGSSLGSGGLSNAGEPLFLRDAEGRRLSAAPARRAPSGACLTRTSEDGRTGAAGAFTLTPKEQCTPGLPHRGG